jgi:haloalkane dehalogenase
VPLDDEPADVIALVEAYDGWLARSDGVPTQMIRAEMTAWCAANIAAREGEHD